ncbi:hypothetical protein ACHAPI_012131 [Fusarium lateritium]
MPSQVNQLWQCNYCSALFERSALLDAHLEYFRSRISELEECRAHAKANANAENDAYDPDSDEDDDDNDDNDDNDGGGSDLPAIRANTKCPFEECDRSHPFKKGQQLRAHYRVHVRCEEVCVCCFKVFRWTSEFIRHTREHPTTTKIKKKYMEGTAVELRKTANKELYTQLESSKKRNSDEADLGEAHISKLLKTNASLPLTMDPSRCLAATDLEQTPAIPPAVPHPIGIASETVLPPEACMITNTLDTTVPAYIQMDSPREEPSHIPDDHEWDPPLFMRLNFPMYSTSTDTVDWFVPPSDQRLQP